MQLEFLESESMSDDDPDEEFIPLGQDPACREYGTDEDTGPECASEVIALGVESLRWYLAGHKDGWHDEGAGTTNPVALSGKTHPRYGQGYNDGVDERREHRLQIEAWQRAALERKLEQGTA